jgi:hypothetical protein
MFKRLPLYVKIILGIVIAALLAVGLYYIPPIHAKLAWRLDNVQTSIYYFFHPPQKGIFVPAQSTQDTATPQPTPTNTPLVTQEASPTPTITPLPLPQSVVLSDVIFVNQMHRWNYCGPSNLAMALEYWGWQGEPGKTSEVRDQVAAVVKPGVNDPTLDFIQRSQTDINVMPYELVDYVNDYTSLKALWRVGGDIDLLKRLIAAGFPVIAEKGIYQTLPPENTMQWAGHYAFTTGYDDVTQEFIWQDSYTPNENIPYQDQGYNQKMSYAEYITNWRAFDYVFIVVYPPEREVGLYQVLGDYVNETWAAQKALNITEQEISSLTGIDLFFAWFNKGTNDGLLTNYGQSALDYDQAISVYNALPEKDRPYRIFFYQTGLYKAYFYTSRYQDLIDFADLWEPKLYNHRVSEELLYWRALAEANLALYDAAYADMRKAVLYHPGFQPALDVLAQWGISP